MHLDDYQDQVCNLWKNIPDGVDSIHFCAIGLAGEVGETLNIIKKSMRGEEINQDALELELGDSLYYLARLANYLGFSLENIAETNLEKVRSFYEASS